jgi:protein-S-isoprenylcysteine O-methyltransferase Ste14
MKKLEIFWFLYFSRYSEETSVWWVKYVVYVIMATPMLIGFIFTTLGLDAKIPTYIFIILFVPFALVWIIVWIYHKYRIKKEENDLHLSQ